MSVKVSICTPTWNRCAFLKGTLQETILQIESERLWDEVEICISDNGSTDNTPLYIESLQQSHPKVRFQRHRFETNQGYSKNMDSVIRSATGEYIFLNGDDDIFRPLGVRALLEQCRTIEASVIFTRNLGNSAGLLDCNSLQPNEVVKFPDLFQALCQLGPFHPTFIGNFIMRKDAYLDHFEPSFLESIYPHTAIVYEILRNSCVEFRNFTCVNVDDSDRRIGECSARGTAIDAARVQTEGHLLVKKGRLEVFRFYKLFLRSLPRAIMNERSGACQSSDGKYKNAGLKNLLDVYRASGIAMIVVSMLWLAARLTPFWIMKRVLR